VQCRVTVKECGSVCAAVGYCSDVTCSAACGGWLALTECGLPSTCAVGDRRYSGGCW
jgi:hypothetical protein